jgi:hypothetical protein
MGTGTSPADVTNGWFSGMRGAAALLLVWTVGWGLGFGGLAEVFVDPDGKVLDIWPAEMAIPGFVGGVVFAILVSLAEWRRPFAEITLPRFTFWGVLSGLALGILTATTGGPIPLELTDRQLIGLGAALGAVAGLGSATFFRLLVLRPVLARRTG